MINIKGLAIATDGNFKRMAVTYDEIDNTGKVTNSNAKKNRVITDESVLDAVAIIENYALSIISE